MKIEEIANTYRNCGFILNEFEGVFFLDNGLINYSFPPTIDQKTNKNIIKSLRWRHLITIIKTTSAIKNAYEFILETDNYSIEKFDAKKRNNIRRSLRDCTFKRPDLNDLYHFGLIINRKTLAKQKRKDKHLIDKKFWENYIKTFYEQESIIILGAYIKERMVGYITVCRINGSYYITDPFYDFEAASSSPTQGLIFTLINQIIERERKIKIYYGVESFKPLPLLNKYKSAMLFERIPTTRVYIIHPFIQPILKLAFLFYYKFISKKKINNPYMQQIVQLLRGSKILEQAVNRTSNQVHF